MGNRLMPWTEEEAKINLAIMAEDRNNPDLKIHEGVYRIPRLNCTVFEFGPRKLYERPQPVPSAPPDALPYC